MSTAPRPLPPTTPPQAPLSVAERLGADTRFSGKGVVAAFLDAGFYAHPDLTQPHSRIHGYVDLIGRTSGVEHLARVDASSWHGMMSSVVAAGNGALSGGRYRSLAPDLGVVLVKVGSLPRVHHDDIARGIEWVLVNRPRYDIRILNISCGGDYEVSYLEDTLSRFAEAAIRAGIVVVAAVGNNGDRPGYVVPPASVPAVISVGGVNDFGDPSLGRLSPRASTAPPWMGCRSRKSLPWRTFSRRPSFPGRPPPVRRRSSPPWTQPLTPSSAPPSPKVAASTPHWMRWRAGRPTSSAKSSPRDSATAPSSTSTTSGWTARPSPRPSSPRWWPKCWKPTRG